MVKQSIPTPEGVTLEVELAGLGSRATALCLDLCLAYFATLFVLVLVQAVLALTPDVFGDFAGGLIAAFYLTPYVILWIFTVTMHGSTPGKRTFGLRVIGMDGSPATPRQHLLRTIALLPDLALFVGSVMLFFAERPRRLGDWLAGTVVVREGTADVLVDPWMKQDWKEREAKVLDLTPGMASRFDEADLALLRDIILRRDLQPAAARELHRAGAAAYCGRVGLEPTKDPRRALKDIFLFLRESRGL